MNFVNSALMTPTNRSPVANNNNNGGNIHHAMMSPSSLAALTSSSTLSTPKEGNRDNSPPKKRKASGGHTPAGGHGNNSGEGGDTTPQDDDDGSSPVQMPFPNRPNVKEEQVHIRKKFSPPASPPPAGLSSDNSKHFPPTRVYSFVLTLAFFSFGLLIQTRIEYYVI